MDQPIDFDSLFDVIGEIDISNFEPLPDLDLTGFFESIQQPSPILVLPEPVRAIQPPLPPLVLPEPVRTIADPFPLFPANKICILKITVIVESDSVRNYLFPLPRVTVELPDMCLSVHKLTNPISLCNVVNNAKIFGLGTPPFRGLVNIKNIAKHLIPDITYPSRSNPTTNVMVICAKSGQPMTAIPVPHLFNFSSPNPLCKMSIKFKVKQSDLLKI